MTTSPCPWMDFTPSDFPICEASTCSWIRQPGNTVSNLVFLAAGIYLLWRAHKTQAKGDRGFALCALLIGSCSAIAHASVTRFFGFFDFAAIFSIFSLVAARNWRHAQPDRSLAELTVFMAIFSLALCLLSIFERFRVLLFVIFVLTLFAWEWKILKSLGHRRLNSHLLQILACFLVGGTAIALDSSRWVCDPDQHFLQLHMLWHTSMAVSIVCLANHFRATRTLPP